MDVKEKAKELVNKYYGLVISAPYQDSEDGYCVAETYMLMRSAKQCALIAVDEIIDTYTQEKNNGYIFYRVLDKIILYWQEVKQEIEKL